MIINQDNNNNKCFNKMFHKTKQKIINKIKIDKCLNKVFKYNRKIYKYNKKISKYKNKLKNFNGPLLQHFQINQNNLINNQSILNNKCNKYRNNLINNMINNLINNLMNNQLIFYNKCNNN